MVLNSFNLLFANKAVVLKIQYDVFLDPQELHECSGGNPGVVKQLNAEMNSVLESYTQYGLDPTCPPHKFSNDSRVGNYWSPWC